MLQDATAYATKVHGPRAENRGAEWVHQMMGPKSLAPLSAAVDPEATIHAYVNHGRWIAECPDCRNAQLACRTDKRFLCNECGNIAVGGLWRPVEWPANVQAVENLLENRPLVNQNWAPGEDMEILAIENLEQTGKVK